MNKDYKGRRWGINDHCEGWGGGGWWCELNWWWNWCWYGFQRPTYFPVFRKVQKGFRHILGRSDLSLNQLIDSPTLIMIDVGIAWTAPGTMATFHSWEWWVYHGVSNMKNMFCTFLFYVHLMQGLFCICLNFVSYSMSPCLISSFSCDIEQIRWYNIDMSIYILHLTFTILSQKVVDDMIWGHAQDQIVQVLGNCVLRNFFPSAYRSFVVLS